MDLLSIIIIAIGLAMDCFAVSISKGISAKQFSFYNTLRMALLFGIFQGAMPLIGYVAGISFANTIAIIDHWVAFVLLGFIGGKMIWEATKETDEEDISNAATKNSFTIAKLLPLAIATSIDALASGIILVPYPSLIYLSVGIIGVISFLFTFLGMYIGTHFGKRFKLNVNVVGGIILISIGTKILIEHLL